MSTDLLENNQAEECAEEVDCAEDDLSDERVRQTNRRKDCRAIVEEVVGTGELLERLDSHAYRLVSESAEVKYRDIPSRVR